MMSQARLSAEMKYDLLMHTLQDLQDTLDLNEILDQLLDAIKPLVAYDAAGVFVLSQDLGAGWGAEPTAVIAGVASRGFLERPIEEDAMLALGAGIIGHVIRTGEGLVIPDVRLEPLYVEGRPETLSEIAVPILRRGQPIGALNLERDVPEAFSAADLDVLSFFADAAAITIDKAILHQQLLEKRRVEHQLRIARDVQARLLPAEAPALPGYDLAGVCLPTELIGGDYYDFLPLIWGRLGLVIADVSGKGVPAALIMSAFRAILRSQLDGSADPAQVMMAANRLLPEFTGKADFVTVLLGILDPESGWIAYANCGHNPPLLLRSDGTVERLLCGGLPLGLFADVTYATNAIRLAPGDALVLYTDGVTDWLDERGEPYGMARLGEAVAASGRGTSADMIAAITAGRRDQSGRLGYEDDYTLVVVKRLGLSG
jgi:serine phosphatase RsbU (regulator of sigma subunit)